MRIKPKSKKKLGHSRPLRVEDWHRMAHQIADMEYFKKKLLAALKIPPHLIGLKHG